MTGCSGPLLLPGDSEAFCERQILLFGFCFVVESQKERRCFSERGRIPVLNESILSFTSRRVVVEGYRYEHKPRHVHLFSIWVEADLDFVKT